MAQLKSSKIGLKNVHISEFDPETNRWTVPAPLSTVKSMTVTVNQAQGEEYNDDQLFEVFDSFENFTVDLSFTDLTPEEQAFLYGWDSIGAIRLQGSDDTPPWIALMGERAKADGTKRLFKYFKGKARPGNEEAQTKGSSVSAQPDSLQIVFAPLPGDFPLASYANKARGFVDEADPAFSGEAAIWYDDVIPGRTVTP